MADETQDRKLRGGLFGCGMISEFHLRGWARIPEVEMVAIGNRTVERAVKRRDEFAPGARVYGDIEEMLDRERLDFIDILTAPELHRAHCLAAKRAGAHVICQKPLCGTLADARALEEEMRGYGRLFVVHENHRYRPWFRRVADMARRGEFGRLHYVRIEHLNATYPAEAYKLSAATGVWLEYGSHLVDMMRCLLGEPSRVYARSHRVTEAVKGETLLHAVYEYESASAVIEAGWKDGALTQGGALVVGDRGEAWYEGTLTRGEQGRLRITLGREVAVDEPRSPYADYVESFYLLEREFTDALLGRGAVTQTAPEHLKALDATFAAYDSAVRGEAVAIRRPGPPAAR